MKIRIIAVGKIKEKYFSDAINEYIKRISAFSSIEIIEVTDEATPNSASEKEQNQIKDKEASKILAKLKSNDYVIALTLHEQELDSMEFSKFLQESLIRGGSCVTFVIGGSLGLSHLILDRANSKLTFSKLTFTHQMSRIIILEQIYRAYKILSHEPYHK